MINVNEINAVCTKIVMILSQSKTVVDKNLLLYCLAITDFVQEDGNLNNKSIRNINSILYYSSIIDFSLNKLILFNIIIEEGNTYKLGFSGIEFVNYCNTQIELDSTIKKTSVAYKKSISSEFVNVYNELYKQYLNEKFSIGEIEKWII